MTEQELRTSITPCIMAGNTWFVFEQIKTYAEAETKELEEAYAELKSSYEKFYESDAVQHKQILALNAEIKRLREVAQRARQYCEYGNGCGGATKLPSGEWFDEGEGTLYHAVLSVLSPAPVTETKLETTADFKFRNRPQDTTDIPVTEGKENESPCRLCLRVRPTIEGYCRICDTAFSPKNEDQE